jgi:hypothetical protein
MYPDIDLRVFKQSDWKQFYGEVKEAIPPNTHSSTEGKGC